MLNRYQLELLINQTCNLKCYACDSYSDYLKGEHDWEELQDSVKSWSKKIMPIWEQGKIPFDKVKILGGEPVLYKKLPELLYLVKESFPKWRVVVGTNGLILNKKTNVLDAIKETGSEIFISVHFSDSDYQKRLKKILQECIEYLGDDYRRINSKDSMIHLIDTTRTNYWKLYHKRDEKGIHPYNANQIKNSYNICEAKYCKGLYKNKLYKCSVHAHLKDGLTHWNQQYSEEWKPYTSIQPATLEMTEEEIIEWCLTDEEPLCNMCSPTNHYVPNEIKQNGMKF